MFCLSSRLVREIE